MRRRRVADAPLPAPVVHDGLQQPRRAPASLPAEDDDIGIGVARVLVPDDQSKCVVAVSGRDVQPGLESSRRMTPTNSPTASAVGQVHGVSGYATGNIAARWIRDGSGLGGRMWPRTARCRRAERIAAH